MYLLGVCSFAHSQRVMLLRTAVLKVLAAVTLAPLMVDVDELHPIHLLHRPAANGCRHSSPGPVLTALLVVQAEQVLIPVVYSNWRMVVTLYRAASIDWMLVSALYQVKLFELTDWSVMWKYRRRNPAGQIDWKLALPLYRDELLVVLDVLDWSVMRKYRYRHQWEQRPLV